MLTGFFIPQHWCLSFLSAFTGVFLLWGIMALFISISNDHILAKRISLLVTKNDSPNLIILLTAMIGGLTAGLSSSTSSSLRNLLKK
jgi:nitrate reductase gamma subunit